MKALFKKTLAVLLSAMLLFTAVPFSVNAAVTAEQQTGAKSGTTGDCAWTLDDNGTLTISGSGAMEAYDDYYDGETWVTNAPWGTSIKSVVIEDGVTSIGESAFESCTGLTSVTIGNSVTSIGYDAFEDCTGLKGVYITDIAAWCIIKFDGYESNPLYYAHKLYLNNQLVKDLVIPDGVTSIGWDAFSDCTGITSVTIPDSVTSIGQSAFFGCTGLTSITISNSVTSIAGHAFRDCTGLTSVTIPDSVTNIGTFAFYGCAGLTGITIPDSVTWIGLSAFDNTAWYNNQPDGLVYAGKVAYNYKGTMPDNTRIEIKDGTKGIAEYAFYYCTGLTGITIPDSVTSIEEGTFYGCSGLKSIIIPDGVTSIGFFAFSDCTGLTSITIPDSVTSIGGYAFGNTAWYNSQPEGVVYAGKVACAYKGTMPDNTSIVLEDGTKGIAYNAFEGWTGLTSVTIPDSVSNIEGYAFHLTGLTSVIIPESVTNVGEAAFGYCENEKIDGFTIYGVKGSAAEAYADENGFNFVSIGEVPTEPTVEPTEPTVEPTEPTVEPTKPTVEPTEPTVEPTEPTVEPTEPPAPEYLVGDVNGDGVINGKDAALLARYTSGWDGYADKVNLDAADINGDGKVNGMDSAILMRYTSGWDGYSKYFT